ncbi:unnamed protein product [Nezara viridula]|uniref:Uncharacterized protein n=1 Tax=Nezara viridula TaxID=85310 RepID=A0A9P0GWZ0_NEZVI|nr:unnamed protein product [Nezara viridula]
MIEATRLPEDSTDAFCLTTNFPLCVETVESTTNYHINKVSQTSAGTNGYVVMRTNIDYYFNLNEKQENVGTPFMNDSMTFSKDFVEVLLTKQFEENQMTEENGLKQDKAIQTIFNKANSRSRKKCKSVCINKKRHRKKDKDFRPDGKNSDEQTSSSDAKSESDQTSSDSSCEQFFIKECTCE